MGVLLWGGGDGWMWFGGVGGVWWVDGVGFVEVGLEGYDVVGVVL